MKRAGWLALAAAVATTALIALSPRAGWFGSGGPLIDHETFADLGSVTILRTQAASRDLVIVLAESAAIPEELHQLAAAGHLVAHVPIEFFLERAAANRDDCLNAVTLLDV